MLCADSLQLFEDCGYGALNVCGVEAHLVGDFNGPICIDAIDYRTLGAAHVYA